MSSTNRGYDRHASDYYVTPQKPIKEFLSAFLLEEKIDRPDRLFFLDPCAGGDELNEMAYPAVIENELGAAITTFDIREDSKAEIIGDYLEATNLANRYDVIITNPPFSLAMPVIKKALNDVKDGGYVVMLLRLNFFGSIERFPFFEDNMPKYTFVHHKRISFATKAMNEKRKLEGLKPLTSDSIEYAHFVWQKGNNQNFSKLFVI